MGICKRWAGRVHGTNTGNLYVELEGEDNNLYGRLHLNDPVYGICVYSIEGSFDSRRFVFQGVPETKSENVKYGNLNAAAILDTKGELRGDWNTDIGSAGTFVLFPHYQSSGPTSVAEQQPQLHTARHELDAVEIEKKDIVEIGEQLQSEFSSSQVIVTIHCGTGHARYLDDFRESSWPMARAESVRIYVQEPEPSGINRIVSIELGPNLNSITTEGSDEAWALGKLEALKREMRRFERTYATNIRKAGFGINQALLIWTIIYIPSLENIYDRSLFVLSITAIIILIAWLHRKYMPIATIYLSPKKPSFWAKIGPSLLSWIIAVTAGVAATILSAWLAGWLNSFGAL